MAFWTSQLDDTSKYLDFEELEKAYFSKAFDEKPIVHVVSPSLFAFFEKMGYINPDGSWRINARGLPTGTGTIQKSG